MKMGGWESKYFIEFPDRVIGDTQDNWTPQTCPLPYAVVNGHCVKGNISSPWQAVEVCGAIPGCTGVDWDSLTGTATLRANATPGTLTIQPGQVAFVKITSFNWALLIGFLGLALALILFIYTLFKGVDKYDHDEKIDYRQIFDES